MHQSVHPTPLRCHIPFARPPNFCAAQVLAITDRTVHASKIKSAYYKAALRMHPDRASEEEKEEATAKFQLIGKVYAILSDEERRKVYDDCGEVDDESALSLIHI